MNTVLYCPSLPLDPGRPDDQDPVRAERRRHLIQIDPLRDFVPLLKVVRGLRGGVGDHGQLPVVVELDGDVLGGVLLHVEDELVLVALPQLEEDGVVALGVADGAEVKVGGGCHLKSWRD